MNWTPLLFLFLHELFPVSLHDSFCFNTFWILALLEIDQSFSSSENLSAEKSLVVVGVTVSHHLSQLLCLRLLLSEQSWQNSLGEPFSLFQYQINQENLKHFKNCCYLMNEAEAGDRAVQGLRTSLFMHEAMCSKGLIMDTWKCEEITPQPIAIVSLQSATKNKHTNMLTEWQISHPENKLSTATQRLLLGRTTRSSETSKDELQFWSYSLETRFTIIKKAKLSHLA